MKKVIEQEIQNSKRIQIESEYDIITLKASMPYFLHCISIEKSKSREVALAICPELESELKEAVELIELYIEKSTHRENGIVYINDFELFEKFNTFLTRHKSKE